MSKIDAYFQSLERQLREDFARRRALVQDSDVKGSGNERAVGEFVAAHVQPVRVVYNKQIIDANGLSSDELDLCGCNFDQPAPATDLIIAEGVDFAVQVKAVLTGDEIDRIAHNAERVKRLTRRHGAGDTVFASPDDIPFFVDRIPYFAIAFESQLKLTTVLNRLVSQSSRRLREHLPDAIFILDRGAVLSVRQPGKELQALEFGSRTLMSFVQSLHNVVGRIRRLHSPLMHYFPSDIQYKGHAVTDETGTATAGDFVGHWAWNDLVGALRVLNAAGVAAGPLGEEGLRIWKMIQSCSRGEFPPEAFRLHAEATAVSLEVEEALAAEASDYLRQRTGIDASLSPYPRFDMPFEFHSKLRGRRVAISMRSEFLNQIQQWVAQRMSLIPRGPTPLPLSWPPILSGIGEENIRVIP